MLERFTVKDKKIASQSIDYEAILNCGVCRNLLFILPTCVSPLSEDLVCSVPNISCVTIITHS